MAVEDALFYSPHAAYQVICSNTRLIRHPTTGDVIETIPGVWARFGKQGAEYEFKNPETGMIDKGADITGHYFDLRVEVEQNNWDDEIAAMVLRKLRTLARRQPEDIQEIPRVQVKAGLPWPTYDQCDAAEVVKLAPVLGVVAEVLAYEAENKARPTVLALESAAADEPEPEPEPEAVPAPKVPAEMAAAATGSRTISV